MLGHKTQIERGGTKRRLSLFGLGFVLIKVAKAIYLDTKWDNASKELQLYP
jgi:hypothetical protein